MSLRGLRPGSPLQFRTAVSSGLGNLDWLLVYNQGVLALAHAVMMILTWLFFIGIAGSLLVILISFVEDLSVLVGKD